MKKNSINSFLSTPSILSSKEKENEATLFWETVTSIQKFQLTRNSYSQSQSSWIGEGSGIVMTKQKGDTLLFEEEGQWSNGEDITFQFYNIYLWKYDRDKTRILLYSVRYHKKEPTLLLILAPVKKNLLLSTEFHVCRTDCYSSAIFRVDNGFHLHWRVVGSKKNEELFIHYST